MIDDRDERNDALIQFYAVIGSPISPLQAVLDQDDKSIRQEPREALEGSRRLSERL